MAGFVEINSGEYYRSIALMAIKSLYCQLEVRLVNNQTHYMWFVIFPFHNLHELNAQIRPN